MNVAQVRAALQAASPAATPPPSLSSVPMPAAPAAGEPKKVIMPAGRWARYAGTLGAALTVTVSAASIRKGGREPNEPDDAEVTLLQEALEEGLKLRFNDDVIPWWLGAALAAGGVYAGMRIGAKKIAPDPAAPPKEIKPDHQPEKKPESPLAPSMFPPAIRKAT